MMNLGTAQVIRANSRHLPLADNTVDLVCTSPPYFALRSYQDDEKCLRCIEAIRDGRNLAEVYPNYAEHAKAEHNKHHYEGQLGSEATPAEFVAALLEVTRECVRVLKPSGSLWVNLGDKYVADNRGSGFDVKRGEAKHAPRGPAGYITGGMRQKSLMGIPWRYALACIDDLGLILRAEVIWSKPNGLPESVTDRVRRSHEQWFHFTLQPRYFSAVDEIREQYAPETTARYSYGFKPASAVAAGQSVNGPTRADGGGPSSTNPLGKLPGSVWTVPTEPLRVPDHLGVDHFAAFPTEWPKRIIAGWSPAGVCVACGEGRRPVIERTGRIVSSRGDALLGGAHDNQHDASRQDNGRQLRAAKGPSFPKHEETVAGHECACALSPCAACGHDAREHHEGRGCLTCGCPREPQPPTTPSVILDPFGGTGTTAMVAKALGRHGISVDMSADYCRLAEWRTNDRNQLAKVLGVKPIAAPPPDQASLFEGLT